MIAHLPGGRSGQALALAFGISVIGLIVFGAIAPACRLYNRSGELLSQRLVVLRHSRETVANVPSLERQATNTADVRTPSALLLSGSDDLAGAALQQRIQELAGAAGGSLVSMETLAAEPAGIHRRIKVRVSVNEPWPVIPRLLAAIGQATPRMLIDDVRLSVSRSRGSEATTIDSDFTVIAFRLEGPPENSR
jgi:hypothetical protein